MWKLLAEVFEKDLQKSLLMMKHLHLSFLSTFCWQKKSWIFIFSFRLFCNLVSHCPGIRELPAFVLVCMFYLSLIFLQQRWQSAWDEGLLNKQNTTRTHYKKLNHTIIKLVFIIHRFKFGAPGVKSESGFSKQRFDIKASLRGAKYLKLINAKYFKGVFNDCKSTILRMLLSICWWSWFNSEHIKETTEQRLIWMCICCYTVTAHTKITNKETC